MAEKAQPIIMVRKIAVILNQSDILQREIICYNAKGILCLRYKGWNES
ncbi:hypothetical protein [Dysosmobacter sp.]